MELFVILAFCAVILGFALAGLSIAAALAAGAVLLIGYGLKKGHAPRSLLAMCGSGLDHSKTMLLSLVLIGCLTACWRASGTLPAIVSAAAGLIRPGIFLPLVFVLTSLLSFLIGTCYGTSATLGVICIIIAKALGVSVLWAGGAVLAGASFGDRCSPISSVAVLHAQMTRTEPHTAMRRALRASVVPYALALLIYSAVGLLLPAGQGAVPDTAARIGAAFNLSPLVILPAVLVPLLSLCRVKLLPTLAAGVGTGCVLAVTVQGVPVRALPALLYGGYASPDASLAPLLDGGGIRSMLATMLIIALAGCIGGLLQGTGLLRWLQAGIFAVARRTNVTCAVQLTSLLCVLVGCSQTLPIMLTDELCDPLLEDKDDLCEEIGCAVFSFGTLVPWSVAGSVPVAMIGVPMASLAAACYLYLLPLCRLVWSFTGGRKAVSPADADAARR